MHDLPQESGCLRFFQQSKRGWRCGSFPNLRKTPQVASKRRLQILETGLKVRVIPQSFAAQSLRLKGYGLRSGKHRASVRNQEEGNGIMKLNQTKKVGIAAFAAGIVISVGLLATPARSSDGDAAATFKTKCVACHGATAEKKFDATMAEEEMVKIILTGKKPEKPPNMPAYGEKGITEDQAKALAGYMKSLKQ